ncbi:MAG: U6 snRNA-associated Sm-like protein LSm6 [Candidatus Korarchaeota archaeon]
MSKGQEMEQPIRKIEKSKNKQVLVRLKDGEEYIGTLVDTDTFMNMVLTDAVELKDGERVRSYGTVFIRGNNIIYIMLEYRGPKP